MIRNRRRVAAFVADPEAIQEEINQEDIAVLDVPTVELEKCDPFADVEEPGIDGNGHEISDEQRVTQVARNERIRAEIEALHKARVEQQERIEASTVGRAGDRPREEPVRLKVPNHNSNGASAFLPNGFSGQLGNGLESATRVESTKTQTESAEDFRFITNLFDDPSPDVRNVAARALYHLQSDRAASFTRALREASPERRRRIGAALSTSGLAAEALSNLAGENLDKAYDAFSVLFLMAKAGEVQSLIDAIQEGPNLEVRLAVVKLLALSGQTEVVAALRRLAVRSSLPPEVRSAVMEAIHQIRTQA
ncbi:MAG TPA: HEAT repeat domain-containing protein [Pyrinomonadaceae bacterium]